MTSRTTALTINGDWAQEKSDSKFRRHPEVDGTTRLDFTQIHDWRHRDSDAQLYLFALGVPVRSRRVPSFGRNLRRFHTPSVGVFEPGLKMTNHAGPCENVQVLSNYHIGRIQRPREFNGIPHLRVTAFRHCPDPAQRLRRRLHPESWKIPLETRPHEILPSLKTLNIRSSEE